MAFEEIPVKNEKRGFTPAEKTAVKDHYVYALQDPRDNKVFYAGQGVNDEVFVHFNQAENFLKGKGKPTSKILRIIDIWCEDNDVNWYIIAHGLDKETANRVESAVIGAFTNSQNGTPLNKINGIHASLLLPEDIGQQAAPAVSVSKACTVFVFSIYKALGEGKSVYDATRSAWRVSEKYRSLDAYAVGLNRGISGDAYKIKTWKPLSGGRFEFEGDETDPLAGELRDKNWRPVIDPVMDYYKYGGYIVVEFDGQGKYRILRGEGPNPEWRDYR
jgi:hypothetical protein